MVQILESGSRILGVSQIPHVEARIHVIVVGDYELGRHNRIPHHLSLLGLFKFLTAR
jgi:hypothetical protein